jgi:hypothetical protein
MCKNEVNASTCMFTKPWKTATSPTVYAQTVDPNIGRPLQKLLSCSSSTSLVFNFFFAQFKILKKNTIKLAMTGGILDQPCPGALGRRCVSRAPHLEEHGSPRRYSGAQTPMFWGSHMGEREPVGSASALVPHSTTHVAATHSAAAWYCRGPPSSALLPSLPRVEAVAAFK